MTLCGKDQNIVNPFFQHITLELGISCCICFQRSQKFNIYFHKRAFYITNSHRLITYIQGKIFILPGFRLNRLTHQMKEILYPIDCIKGMSILIWLSNLVLLFFLFQKETQFLFITFYTSGAFISVQYVKNRWCKEYFEC